MSEMIEVDTCELKDDALDWAVAKCEGFKPHAAASLVIMKSYNPSTDWTQGGPIIERQGVSVGTCVDGQWGADMDQVPNQGENYATGPTPLIAAMRCYVASKLGPEVSIPAELLPTETSSKRMKP